MIVFNHFSDSFFIVFVSSWALLLKPILKYSTLLTLLVLIPINSNILGTLGTLQLAGMPMQSSLVSCLNSIIVVLCCIVLCCIAVVLLYSLSFAVDCYWHFIFCWQFLNSQRLQTGSREECSVYFWARGSIPSTVGPTKILLKVNSGYLIIFKMQSHWY